MRFAGAAACISFLYAAQPNAASCFDEVEVAQLSLQSLTRGGQPEGDLSAYSNWQVRLIAGQDRVRLLIEEVDGSGELEEIYQRSP